MITVSKQQEIFEQNKIRHLLYKDYLLEITLKAKQKVYTLDADVRVAGKLTTTSCLKHISITVCTLYTSEEKKVILDSMNLSTSVALPQI
jgi:hypothetical protein